MLLDALGAAHRSYRIGRPEHARDKLIDALTRTELGRVDPRVHLEAFRLLGHCHLCLGDFHDAALAYGVVLDAAGTLNKPHVLLETRMWLGEALRRSGQLGQAEMAWRDLVRDAAAADMDDLRDETLARLADHLLTTKRVFEAARIRKVIGSASFRRAP